MAASETSVNNNLPWEPCRLTYLKPSLADFHSFSGAAVGLWHKFIIYDAGKYEKADVLISVIATCDSEVLLPVMYTVEDGHKGTFLTQCNSNVIEKFVNHNLRISLPNRQILNMDIILGFLTMAELRLNIHKTIAQALCCRYEPMKKTLNLDEFQKEKLLSSIYCPIAVPKVLTFVLRCAKMGVLGNIRDTRLPIRELSMQANGITAIMPFEKFFNYHLTKLDLRYNQIADIEYLRYFSEFKITELWLDGNPLCTKFSIPDDYIRTVKTVFPHLQRLDGILIGVQKKYVPAVQSNYLGDGTRIGLIGQFVKHFFTLYDQDDRIVMNGLYDTDAFYSMTLGTSSNYTPKPLTRVLSSNRNLLKFVDYAKCHEFLLQGPERIIYAFRQQPRTVHNFKTFHVDLLHKGENHIAISVQGLFYYKNLKCPLISFNRTFIIVAKEDNEYSIVNDQCHIDITSLTLNTTDNNELKFDVKDAPKFKPTLFSVSEKEQLLRFLHELTTMNRTFCQKYLNESNWDIRAAISSFMKAYTVNNVPREAFRDTELFNM